MLPLLPRASDLPEVQSEVPHLGQAGRRIVGLLPWSLRCQLAASWWWGGKGGVGSGPPSQPAAPSQWPQAEDAGPPAVGFKPPRPTLCPLVQHSVPVPCRLLFYFPPPLPPLGAALLIPLVFAHRWPPDSGGVRGRDCHPLPGRAGLAALPPRDGHAPWSSQKGRCPHCPFSLRLCLSSQWAQSPEKCSSWQSSRLCRPASATGPQPPPPSRPPRSSRYRSPADWLPPRVPLSPAATSFPCGDSCPGWGCVFRPLVGPSRGHRGNVGALPVLCKDTGCHSHSHRLPSSVPGSGSGSPGPCSRLSHGSMLSCPLWVAR